MKHLLKKIEASDSLASIFNLAIDRLNSFFIMSTPRHWSVSEYNSLPDLRTDEQYFLLILMCNSLHSIHDHYISSLRDIQEYMNKYNGDPMNYAIKNRIESINEFGGEESDYDQNGDVLYKDDLASITPYTIVSELKFRHFANEESRGEFIGTSGTEEWKYLYSIIENNEDLRIEKMLPEIGYKKIIDGELKEVDFTELVEESAGRSHYNEILSVKLRITFDMSSRISEFVNQLDPFDDKAISKLRDDLLSVINQKYLNSRFL